MKIIIILFFLLNFSQVYSFINLHNYRNIFKWFKKNKQINEVEDLVVWDAGEVPWEFNDYDENEELKVLYKSLNDNLEKKNNINNFIFQEEILSDYKKDLSSLVKENDEILDLLKKKIYDKEEIINIITEEITSGDILRHVSPESLIIGSLIGITFTNILVNDLIVEDEKEQYTSKEIELIDKVSTSKKNVDNLQNKQQLNKSKYNILRYIIVCGVFFVRSSKSCY